MRVYGPYTRKDNRKIILIYNDDGSRRTKSYPKYLLEQKLGRELVGDETCDHTDEDFTNDDLSNLQVLSLAENAAKSMKNRPKKLYNFVCEICGTNATKSLRNVKHNHNLGRRGPYCGRQCAGKAGRK